jgi:hypothetical protein
MQPDATGGGLLLIHALPPFPRPEGQPKVNAGRGVDFSVSKRGWNHDVHSNLWVLWMLSGKKKTLTQLSPAKAGEG